MEKAHVEYSDGYDHALIRYPSYFDAKKAHRALKKIYKVSIPSSPPEIVGDEIEGATKTLRISIYNDYHGRHGIVLAVAKQKLYEDLKQKMESLMEGEHGGTMLGPWEVERRRPGEAYNW